jgi:hypothetical protein
MASAIGTYGLELVSPEPVAYGRGWVGPDCTNSASTRVLP